MKNKRFQTIDLPETVILIKPIYGILSNNRFVLDKEKLEYNCTVFMSFADIEDFHSVNEVKITYPAAMIIAEPESFLTKERFESKEVLDYKKQAIDNLVEQLKQMQ